MIVEIKKLPKYGRFFLSTEAPADENETTDTDNKRNVKVVNIKANNSRRTDFNKVEENQETDNNEGTDENQELDAGDDEDFTNDENNDTANNQDADNNEEENTETNEDNENTNNEEPETDENNQNDVDAGDDEDFTNDENNDTENNQDADNNEGTDANQELDTGTDEDFTNDENNDTENNQDADNNEEENKISPGLEFDSTRKYNLFQEFMSLYNAVENYISKLEINIKDNIEQNKIFKTATNKLREIQNLIYDYMIMKFELNSYVQSLLFYQKMIAAVQLVFKLLMNNKTNNNDK